MPAAALAFAAAALVLTLTPGLDTMFVVRTSMASGRSVGLAGGLGVCTGTLVWGAASAAGVTALLVASRAGYDALRIVGAVYLTFVGARMIWRSRRTTRAGFDPAAGREVAGTGTGWTPGHAASALDAFRTGLLTNLLNPKVGVFYVTLLPQFVPHRAPVFAFSLLLASIHACEGFAWFALITAGLSRVRHLLRQPSVRRVLDRTTGVIFIGCGVRLALEGRRRATG